METMEIEKIEYRVRPVVRYVVTRFESQRGSEYRKSLANSEGRGEYDNAQTAYEVAYALCRAEHERLGYPLGDMRIIYPNLADVTQKKRYADGCESTGVDLPDVSPLGGEAPAVSMSMGLGTACSSPAQPAHG